MPAIRCAAIAVVLVFVSCLVGLGQQQADLPKAPDSIEVVPVRVFEGMGRAGIVHNKDGKTFVTSGDGTLRTWDLESGEELTRVEHPLYKNWIFQIRDGRVCLIDWKYFPAKKDPPKSNYSEYRLMDAQTRQEICLLDHVDATTSVGPSADARSLIGRHNNGGGCVWDMTTGKLVVPNPLVGITRSICGFRSSPDGRYFAVGPDDTLMQVMDARTGREIWKIQPEDYTGFSGESQTFSADSQFLAGGQGTIDDDLRLRDATTGKVLARLKWQPDGVFNPILKRMMPVPERTRGVSFVEFAPDGRTVLVACCDRRVAVVEVATWQMRYRIEEDGGRLDFFPQGFLVGTSDSYESRSLRLWDRMNPSGIKDKATEEQLQQELLELEKQDAVKAWKVMRRMSNNPAEAIAVLRQSCKPAPIINEAILTGLINDLDADDFEIRERAQQRLKGIGSTAGTVLRAALKTKLSVEARTRVAGLVEAVDDRTNPDRLRAVRIAEVLEYIASPEAKKLLQEWAGGAPEAFLTVEARASLSRLSR